MNKKFKEIIMIADFIPQGVLVTDTSANIVYLNANGEQITGFKSTDLQGDHCSKLFGTACSESSIGCYLSGTSKMSGFRFNMLTDLGKIITIEKSVQPIHSDDGTIIGGLEIFQRVVDIRSDFESLKDEYYASKKEFLKQQNLLNIGLLITSSLSLHRILLRIINTLKSDFAYENIVIYLPNEKDELEIWARSGLPQNVKNGKPLQFGKGAVGKCFRKVSTIIVNDSSKYPDYTLEGENIKSEIAVPIVFQENAIGVISAKSGQTDSFSDEDKSILTMIGNFAAIAINNAKLTYELASAKDTYKSLFNESSDPIFITDETNTSFLDCNTSAMKIYGYTKPEFASISPAMLLNLDSPESINPQSAFSGSWEGIHLTKAKKEIYVESKSTHIEYKGGKAYLTIVRDISDRKNLEQRLKILSETDELTGLFNRRYFIRKLGDEIDRANRYDHPLSLIMLDIDFFKQYNDQLGHQAGDKLLNNLGKLLLKILRATDIPCRYGGDEFSIILPHIGHREAKQLAERIQAGYQAMKFLSTSLSIGISIYSKGLDQEELLVRADKSLYYVKQKLGKGNIAIFDVDLSVQP